MTDRQAYRQIAQNDALLLLKMYLTTCIGWVGDHCGIVLTYIDLYFSFFTKICAKRFSNFRSRRPLPLTFRLQICSSSYSRPAIFSH